MALTIWLQGNEWFDRVGTKSCAHPTKFISLAVLGHVSRKHQIRFDNGMVFVPLFRPEHRSFWRNRPDRGAAGGRSFSQGQGWPFENPRQKQDAQEQGGIRVAFSLDTFFWRSKRKYLGCRAETRLQ